VPFGLNERILQATLGTVVPHEVKAPWTSRAASWLRLWLDPIVSPQLASVATMLLVSVLVLTNTVSADGSIGGVYNAGMQLAEQTSGQARQLTDAPKQPDTQEEQQPVVPPPPAKDQSEQKKDQKPGTKPNGIRDNR
jgi:hypothetical protein